MTSQSFNDAVACYDRGEFATSRGIFESLLDKASIQNERELYLFNIASCLFSEGNHSEANKYIEKLGGGSAEDCNDPRANKMVPNELLRYLKLQLECKRLTDEQFQDEQFDFLHQSLESLSELQPISPHFHLLRDLVKTMVDNKLSALWQTNQFHAMERLLLKVKKSLCSDTDTGYADILQKNMGHVLFMMDTRYEECLQIYEDLLPKSDEESILSADPLVLANLCVVYVLTGRNSDAEQLIKEVEQEENEFPDFSLAGDDIPDSVARFNEDRIPHSQHINLAIETLYCVKGNYEFGLSRMFKTMEPLKEKLTCTTWFHAKRCILALLNQCCKQAQTVNDDLFDNVVKFLFQCEILGANIPARIHSSAKCTSIQEQEQIDLDGRNSVTYEARYLRSLCLTVIHD